METLSNITVLLVHDNIDEANRLVSLLRNANYVVDPHYAANAAELNNKIQERNWELILAQFAAQSIPAKNIIHQIRRLNKDIPVIFVVEEFNFSDAVEALKMGAADVVPMDEDQYFIQTITRTLDNLEQRRKLRYWKRRFAESEDRFESLILSSQDGIAIIQEGTYVHVNNAYAHFFGFLDADSMVLLPVFDTIDDASQGSFKKYLKPLDEHNAWDTEVIQFEGQRQDNVAIPVQATLSQIDFHGDPALQLLIKKSFMHGDGEDFITSTSTTQTDGVVSKIRLHDMIEAINGAIRRAAGNGTDALLFYIQVDQYENLQKHLGIGKTENGITQLAHFLDTLIPERVVFGRIREEAFVLILPSNDAEKSLAFANRLVKEVSSQIFKTDNSSFSCTLSIGITFIGEATASADEGLTACQKAIAELQGGDGLGKQGNGVKFHEPVLELGATSLSDNDAIRIGKQLLKKDLVTVAFQPIISLHGLNDELYEVLMRVAPGGLPETELPADFIGRVFKTSIGIDLDKAVITEALKKLASKKKTAPNTRLLMNLCLATIEDEKFIHWLQKTIETSQVSPRDLIFQMREIDISSRLGNAANMLERLHNFGASTGLTHYGLAINPLTIFNKIAVDYVKVDSVLSEKAQKDKTALTTLNNLLTELKGKNCKIIVPHIESATIIPSLWQAEVDFLQGYYIQEPSTEMAFDFSQE
ncbi:MAG: EAL domain-containing protein [Porticoccaceae bacterium]|nr:EAL domain-containing protein [Porticoccaceae bacterium]